MTQHDIDNALAVAARAFDLFLSEEVLEPFGTWAPRLRSKAQLLSAGIVQMPDERWGLALLFTFRSSPAEVVGYADHLGLRSDRRMTDEEVAASLWETMFGLYENLESGDFRTAPSARPIRWMVGHAPRALGPGPDG